MLGAVHRKAAKSYFEMLTGSRKGFIHINRFLLVKILKLSKVELYHVKGNITYSDTDSMQVLDNSDYKKHI